MIFIRQFAVIAVTGLLGLAPAVALASPPILSDLVVEPTILTLGSGTQTVNISVTALDPDGDLNPEKTKVTVKFDDKSKLKTTLMDEGGGQFTGQIKIDTATAQTLSVKVKAKDFAQEKALKLTTTVVITDAAITPTAITTDQSEWVGDSGEVIFLETRVVNQDGPEVGVPNWPVTFTQQEGTGVILPSGESGASLKAQRANTLEASQVQGGSVQDTLTVFTDAQGITTLAFQIGPEGVSIIEARAQGVPAPVIFRVVTLGAPLALAVEADGSLVVLDENVRGVVRVNPDTGERTILSSAQLEIGAGPDLFLPEGLVLAADGSIVVVDTFNFVLRVDSQTGARTLVTGCLEDECLGTGPPINQANDIAIEADGSLIVAQNDGIIRINPDTRDRTLISGCSVLVFGSECTGDVVGSGPELRFPGTIAVERDGSLVVTDGSALVRIDPASGDRSIVADTGVGVGTGQHFPDAVAVDRDGSLLVAGGGALDLIGGGMVLRVNPVTGNRTVISGCDTLDCETVIGRGPEFSSIEAMAIEADGGIVVIDQTRGAILRIDPTTGDRTTITQVQDSGSGPPLNAPQAITVESGGALIVAGEQAIWRVDPRTGARTILADETTGVGPRLPLFPGGIAIEADGFLVMTDLDAVLRVDPRTGDRVTVSGCENVGCEMQIGTGQSFSFLRDIAVEANGSLVLLDTPFGIGTPGAVVRVNTPTGDRMLLSGCSTEDCTDTIGFGPIFGSRVEGIVVESDGSIVVVDDDTIVRVDAVTGDRTIVSSSDDVGNGTFFFSLADLAIEADGSFVALGFQNILRFDPSTGDRVIVSDESTGEGLELNSPLSIAVEADGSLVVVDELSFGSGAGAVIRVDQETGDRTVLSR